MSKILPIHTDNNSFNMKIDSSEDQKRKMTFDAYNEKQKKYSKYLHEGEYDVEIVQQIIDNDESNPNPDDRSLPSWTIVEIEDSKTSNISCTNIW